MLEAYYLAALLSVIQIVIFAIFADKKVRFYSASFFVFSAISNVGFCALMTAKDINEAILANKIVMFGSAFLPLITLFIILEMSKIELPKLARVSLVALALTVYSLILTMGYTEWFATDIHLIQKGTIMGLVYRPMWGQLLFVMSMNIYAIATVIAVATSLIKKRQVPAVNLILMTSIYIFQFLTNSFGKGLPIDITPFQKVLANIIFLIVIYRMPLYDTDEALLVSNAKRKDVAYILIDKHFRFMGCSHNAEDFIPAIANLKIDRPFKSDSEELSKILGWVKEYYPDKKDILEISCNGMDFLVNIQFLYHENIKRGYIVTISDDQLRREQIRLVHAMSENKTRFLSNVSHELRTPVNSVLGMNEMILRESDNPQILDYASCIDTSGKTLLSLINDILDMSRIEAGKLELQPIDYSMREMLLEIERLMEPLLKEKKLAFEIKLNENLPNMLYGDGVRVKQMLVNLLTNAVKYTDAGTVTFIIDGSVKDNNIDMVYKVMDTGRGIKKEHIPNLFTAYERVDEKKNAGIIGTGLGLSITKKFAEMMDGIIEVESEYGKGSTFVLKICQAVKAPEPIGNLHDGAKNVKRQKKAETFHAPEARILSVDDMVLNQKVISNLLKRNKVQVDMAFGGMECIEKLKENSYDLIFLDHMMPEIDGVETLRIIREEKIAENTPIIAMTANAVGDAKTEYLNMGFDGYLSKPVSVQLLEETLINLLPKDKVELL